MQLAIPTVHLNGTSRAELVKQCTDAMEAIRLAIEAATRAHPNGRDYYPQGPDAIKAAQEQHRSRIARLTAVREEFYTIAQEIAL